jgi:beta-mannosidase
MLGPGTSNRRRELLTNNWSFCAAPAGAVEDPKLAEKLSWTRIAEPMPAAAALRALGQWSINGSARQFDAEDWWYRAVFDAPDRKAGESAVLGFDGLATIVKVWLNGNLLLVSSNMFISHECDVSSALVNKDNQLLIHFSALDGQLAKHRQRPRWRAPMVAHQQLRWIRTTLLGRTPGWSPPAAVVGPWKGVWLERRGQLPDVENIVLEVSLDGTAGIVKCRLELDTKNSQAVDFVELQLERHGKVHVQRLDCRARTNLVTGEMRLNNADIWWPHTHGEACLYNASLSVGMEDVAGDTVIDLGAVGFRTIALDTSNGNFSLSVNGVPVFCRGAVWTPLDPVTLRSSPEECRAAIVQARAAGMNMLRVAGSMVYEEDHFYASCDEQGILVWQDLMFANMDYPGADAGFMASVLAEVRQQLCRLQARACLALFCGNSEVEQQAAMWGASRELWQSSLFEKTLAELCAEHAAGTPYWPSSAHGGSFPHQASAGTTSYYGVGAYLNTLDDARRANVKFATECLAFANIPAPAAIGRMPGGFATRVHHPGWKERSPRDLGAGWDFDDVRDHYLGAVFGAEPLKLRYSDHDRYLTLGRMTTGEVMAASFAEWRRPASPCQGAMVLFLRDLWAGAGWGLIDDAGAPKACYHYLKRVLQPVTVLLSDEGVNGLIMHVINERGEGQHLELELTAWRDGDVRVASGKKVLTVPARSTQSVASADLFDHFIDLTHAYKFGPMVTDAVVVTLKNRQGEQLARAFHFPGGLGIQTEPDVGLSARAIMLNSTTAELTIQTRRLARGVYFDMPGFQADNEYFHLPPDSEAKITLRGAGARPLMGSVQAANSIKSARVDVSASEIAGRNFEAAK